MTYAQSKKVTCFLKAVCFEVRRYFSPTLMLFEYISVLYWILSGNAPQAFFTFIFLNKAPSVLGNQPQESVFFSPSDKDRAAYSAAREASPSLHLLSCQLWQQQQEERPGGDPRYAAAFSHVFQWKHQGVFNVFTKYKTMNSCKYLQCRMWANTV